MQEEFAVHFWGVRGSIACPGPETVRYGGNTSCVEMRVNGRLLIFDGGTGLRELGQQLLKQKMPIEGHIFFTHYHWDHIQGFPFFTPAFIKGNRFHIHGKIAPDGSNVEKSLNDQMLNPNFPVPLQIMQAKLEFHDFELDQFQGTDPVIGPTIVIGEKDNEITVETSLLNHPGEAVGYRVNWRGRAATYITDTEHLKDRMDPNVLWLARDADVLIYDATYTDDEYYSENSPKIGWGHSTWQEAVRVAKAANAKRLIIFHHDPLHNDDCLDQIGEEVARAFPNSMMAREGLSILLPVPVSVA